MQTAHFMPVLNVEMCFCKTPQNYKHPSITPLMHQAVAVLYFHIIIISIILLWIWNSKRDTSNMKAWQLMGATSWGPFCFPRDSPTPSRWKGFAKFSKASSAHAAHPHFYPTPGWDLRLGRGHKCRQKEFSELTLPVEVKGFWTHLLNFAFSIWYFFCVHKGVEYPLQEKPERMCERLFGHKCHRKAAPKGGWVGKWDQRGTWGVSQCQASQGEPCLHVGSACRGWLWKAKT